MTNSDHILQHIPHVARIGFDITSVGLVIGTLFNHLPAIAAAVSIAWGTMRLVNEINVWRDRRRKQIDD